MSFPHLIETIRPSRMMLISSAEWMCFLCSWSLLGKHWVSYQQAWCLLVTPLSRYVYWVEKVLCISTPLRFFITSMCWILLKAFSVSSEMIINFSSIVSWYDGLMDTWMLNHPCISGLGLVILWLWYVILLRYCWIPFTNILLRISASIFYIWSLAILSYVFFYF